MSLICVQEPGAAWAEGRLWQRQQARTVSDASARRVGLLVVICSFMVFWLVMRRLQRLGSALLVADATGAGRFSSPPAAMEEIRKNWERLHPRLCPDHLGSSFASGVHLIISVPSLPNRA